MIVYFHRNKITLEIFYVGIASNIKRAYKFNNCSRNKFWYSYLKKHGDPVVQIVHNNLPKEIACAWERYYIKLLGKRINGGQLVNLADGGETNAGYVQTELQKNLCRERNKIKGTAHLMTKEIRLKAAYTKSNSINKPDISGEKNPNFGNKWTDEMKANLSAKNKGKAGRKDVEKIRKEVSERWKDPEYRSKMIISISKSSKNNWDNPEFKSIQMERFSKTWKSENRISKMKSAWGKKVINLDTNEVFDTIVDAAKSINMHKDTLRHKLNGKAPNETKLRYAS